MGLFSFAESPQLQALLGDIAPPSIRDASYALYFTMAFGVGSLWVALYGVIIERAGEATGLPIVFGLMAVSFILAALATLPIQADERARANAAYEADAVAASARGRPTRRSPDVGWHTAAEPGTDGRRDRGSNGRPDPARRGRPLDPRGDRHRPAQRGLHRRHRRATAARASTASAPSRSTSSCST